MSEVADSRPARTREATAASFTSVKGVLCSVSIVVPARPAASEQRRRRCSTATGLRFCGMIELIWTNASGTRKCPISNPVQALRYE